MAVRLTALTWDGSVNLRANGLFGWIDMGLFDGLDVRGRDDTLLGQDGEFIRNRKWYVRKIIVGINVQGQGTTVDDRANDYIAKRVTLEADFTLKSVKNLAATLLNTDVYTIAARPVAVDWEEFVGAPDFGRLIVALEAKGDPPNWTVT